ncbi:hypothetical protein ARMSODRAFT_978331 [Armillaria solidipes]|uniref:Uncharacterized protein n=1 Tax=Armillaria solidipes TaxID=1076256 RepID=A0A2H3B9I9_9AGAR|nr:hypothetical protein ARMSODRAFT_978331 [Armillaria solidipes]
MEYEYDTHICELTVHSSDPARSHSVVPSIAVPNALSLRWCKPDATGLSTVVDLLTAVKTIALQGTSIRRPLSIPPSITEITLWHCSVAEAALMSILSTGGSLAIGGPRTEFLWGEPHSSPVPVHLEELSVNLTGINHWHGSHLCESLQAVSGIKRLCFTGDLDMDVAMLQPIIDKNNISLTQLTIQQEGNELKVIVASMSSVPSRQLQHLTVRIKITVLADEDRERHANSLRRFAQLIYGYAVKAFVSACFRRLQTLENVKYPGINWRNQKRVSTAIDPVVSFLWLSAVFLCWPTTWRMHALSGSTKFTRVYLKAGNWKLLNRAVLCQPSTAMTSTITAAPAAFVPSPPEYLVEEVHANPARIFPSSTPASSYVLMNPAERPVQVLRYTSHFISSVIPQMMAMAGAIGAAEPQGGTSLSSLPPRRNPLNMLQAQLADVISDSASSWDGLPLIDTVLSTPTLPFIAVWYDGTHLGPHASVQALINSTATPFPTLKRTMATHVVAISTIPRGGFPHPAVSLAQCLVRFATTHAIGGHIEVTNASLQTIASRTCSNLTVAVLHIKMITPEARQWIDSLAHNDQVKAKIEKHMTDEEYALIDKNTLTYIMQTTQGLLGTLSTD